MKLNNKKKRFGKKKLLLLAVLPLLLAGGASAYYVKNREAAPVKQPSGSAQSEDEEINLDPPSEEEVKATEEYKKNIGSQPARQATSGSKNKAKPVMTSYGVYSGSVEVGARVPKVFETSGTCTLKLSKDGKTVSKSRKAVPNVSEMSCGFITIPTSQLSSGTWSAKVSYSSNKFSGTSDTVNIRVP